MQPSFNDLLDRLEAPNARRVRDYIAAPPPDADAWPATERMLRQAEAQLRGAGDRGRQAAAEAAFLHEALARRGPPWRETAFFLGRAIVLYNRAGDQGAALRCHRRLRAAAPADLPPRQAMALWRPAGVALSYAASGHAAEALDSTAALAAAVAQWSVWERFQLHMLRGRLRLELGEASLAEDEGRLFTAWATALAPDDPALHLGNVSPDGAVDFDIHSDAGRWYCVCELFALIVVRARIAAGRAVGAALDELQGHLDSYDAGWRAAREGAAADERLGPTAEDFRKGVGAACGFAGWVACEARDYERCIRLLDRQEETLGALYAEGPLYRAAAEAASGRTAQALETLASVDVQQTRDGRARAFVGKHGEFDPLRGEAAFATLTKDWR